MKITTIRYATYGTFIIGALIMFFAAMFPGLADYMAVLMYIGGAIGVLGVVFCISSLLHQPCPGCRDYIVIQRFKTPFCPCCQEELQ